MAATDASSSSGLVAERPAEGVVALWLDRPERRNALDAGLTDALLAGFATRGARAFVLGSSDPGWFCAGADLRMADDERAAVSDRLYALYRAMVLAPAPIVVAVGGAAVGGGAQLALAGDIRVGGPDAAVRFAGPGHGLAVGSWGLPSLVGRGRALDLCLTMRTVGSDEALRIGLLDRVVADPRETALELATAIAGLDSDAAGRIKAIVREGTGLLDALEAERAGNRPWSGSTAGLTRGAETPR
jgi:enoyl-CoA hydratase/carnithine racemase